VAGIETGGRRDRAVVQPTVLSNTQPHMKVEAEEIFSPVMTVSVYD
jgi:glyceraldehyde-3-phosphate dehydrogenase (NADP+)